MTELEPFVTSWLFEPEVWLILGLVLIALDIFVGMQFFVLSPGLASFIVGGLLQAQLSGWFGDSLLFETWRGLLIWWAVLSVLSIGLVRKLFQKKNADQSDINEY